MRHCPECGNYMLCHPLCPSGDNMPEPEGPNARFWIWYGEDEVKLTLEPGETVSFSRGGPTDEGYSYTHEMYEHCGEYLRRTLDIRASDCDGRLDHHSSQIGDLKGENWEKESAYQRDYEAERMGY